MRIVLLGATGLVGNHLLAKLLTADTPHQILSIGRTKPALPKQFKNATQEIGSTSKQFEFIESDLQSEEKTSEIITAFQTESAVDLLICCLGTTIKAAGSRQAFFNVDHDLVLKSAKSARQCGIKRMMLISAINANDQSNVFYSKVKGQAEQSLKALGFSQLVIIKPSLLMGQRNTFRFAESVSAPIMRLINPMLLGSLKKYRGIEGAVVAECMEKQLTNPKQGVLEVFPADYL